VTPDRCPPPDPPPAPGQKSSGVRIIPCDRSHAAAIREIVNEVILTSTAVYDYEPRALATVEAWLAARLEAGQPVLGAVAPTAVGGALVGYASYGPFRPFAAYRYTVEHSVHVASSHRGRGVGRALMEQLVSLARVRGIRTMVGGIDAANEPSRALHRSLGFEPAGTIRQAGYKFGRWLDLEFWQLVLEGPAAPRET
jgi:L-amino acid N-acyltransferase YncA